MKFGPIPTAEAEGATLAHATDVDGARWPKGRRLSGADIVRLREAAIDMVSVARLEPGDISEDDAAARLAAALTSTGLRVDAPRHGRCNILADAAGLFDGDAAAITALNLIDERITLGTLAPRSRVRPGEIVATIKIIPYAVPDKILATALHAVQALRLHAFQLRHAALIHTRLAGSGANPKVEAKTTEVTAARLSPLGGTLIATSACAHDPAALADALRAQDAELLLIAAASATSDSEDVVPAAIRRAGGTVLRTGMPVDPGNLLVLGRLADKWVIGLPGCARSPKRNGIDLLLESLAARLPVDSAIIAGWGVGGLLAEAERPEPRATAHGGITGGIVLAAGRASRMGGPHKLLEMLGDRPIIAHVLDSLAAAGLPPPVVVLGHEADAVRAAIGARPARFVVASDAALGMSQSIRAGIGAVPGNWDAALLCLGDMPAIRPDTLRQLADAPDPATSVVIPITDGQRGNPLRWGRAHFADLARLEGDIGGKALLGSLSPVEIDIDDPGIWLDIDTPAALDAARAAYSDASSQTSSS